MESNINNYKPPIIKNIITILLLGGFVCGAFELVSWINSPNTPIEISNFGGDFDISKISTINCEDNYSKIIEQFSYKDLNIIQINNVFNNEDIKNEKNIINKISNLKTDNIENISGNFAFISGYIVRKSDKNVLAIMGYLSKYNNKCEYHTMWANMSRGSYQNLYYNYINSSVIWNYENKAINLKDVKDSFK